MFNSHIPQKTLAKICRSLSTMLNAGVDLIKAVEVVGRKSGNATCRRVLADVGQSLRSGDELTSALNRQGSYFPPLFVDMIHVAESTGKLPEVLTEMANHYENLVRLRRDFLSWVAWPLLQLLAAIFVVALLILVIGLVSGTGPEVFDPLGFGLLGPAGALTWLEYCFGSIFALYLLYMLITRTLGQRRALHRLFLAVPVLGTCMQSFAVARFSWGFFLTQDAGMPIGPSLEASLKATGNGAFAGAAPRIIDDVMAGSELGAALEESRLFPDEFIHIVQVAETSGTVPEELNRLSPNFEDQARRSLRKMAATASVIVWMIVAGLIVFIIFQIFTRYILMIEDAARAIN